ncbi:hypothetical protein ILUMI_00889 [Ignelater luminosus]|uniref:Uncharacterized protein n=1 Tax=Ignelater luminosus TaxID=2038154 RepID=A0A8K0GHZ7_IGNLU|nr:hypothetical protein ILUMI_00889 [Ignelater luminosus]
MKRMSEDILSFLFKYPISKLSTAEAAQVEMLITTLNIQKPVLRASDIFTVGTRLLASVSIVHKFINIMLVDVFIIHSYIYRVIQCHIWNSCYIRFSSFTVPCILGEAIEVFSRYTMYIFMYL